MSEFRSKRVTHEYIQTNAAPPERVFPLLCPVREVDWVPGWQYQMIYSDSGVAEAGCIFTTPNEDKGQTTWIVTHHDPSTFYVAFAWINPGLVAAEITIRLEPKADGDTAAHIAYRYTSLSEEGNREVDRYDEKWFVNKMEGWEAAINYYLRTGTLMKAAGWE